jgi:inosine-uridine nucleoside N-ribohydrolase
MKYVLILFTLFSFAVHPVHAVEKQKIILDFDLGSDIDDAFALALVLASPELDLVGITLDHGLTDKRAQIACKMLYETGHADIPVAVGRPTPNMVGKDSIPGIYMPQYHWAEGFNKLKPIKTDAVDFLLQSFNKYPGEIVLFTTGPVPNMADLLKKDPSALKKAKAIYSMFGSFYMGYGRDPVPSPEWNVAADVNSARVFVEAGAPIIYAGLDVTTFVSLDENRRQQLLMRQTPLTDALCGLYTLWGQETPVLYDPVAIGMLLWPDLFSTRPAHVRVLEGGYTVIDESKPANGRVGMSIRKEEFIRRMMARLIEQNFARD